MQENKTFKTQSTAVGKEGKFYEPTELSSADLQILHYLIDKNPNPQGREINRRWLDLTQTYYAAKRVLEASERIRDTKRAELSALLDINQANSVEGWHTSVEQSFQDDLNQLQRGEAEFYDDDNRAISFITYLSFQYMRTPGIKKRLIAAIPPIAGHDPRRTWLLETLILSTNVGASLAYNKSQYFISFLDNYTKVPFITTDQPVINLLGADDIDVAFFYPVTPQRAIVYSCNEDRWPKGCRSMSMLEVESLNHRMYTQCWDQLYSNDEAYLKALTSLDKTL